MHHIAFVYGQIGDGANVPVRLHRADVVGDVFGGAQTINAALARFKAEGRGVLVYLRDGTAGVPAAAASAGGRFRFRNRAHRGNGARSASARRS